MGQIVNHWIKCRRQTMDLGIPYGIEPGVWLPRKPGFSRPKVRENGVVGFFERISLLMPSCSKNWIWITIFAVSKSHEMGQWIDIRRRNIWVAFKIPIRIEKTTSPHDQTLKFCAEIIEYAYRKHAKFFFCQEPIPRFYLESPSLHMSLINASSCPKSLQLSGIML